jgi:hypothetical protein
VFTWLAVNGETRLSGFDLASHFALERQMPEPVRKDARMLLGLYCKQADLALEVCCWVASTRLSNLGQI